MRKGLNVADKDFELPASQKHTEDTKPPRLVGAAVESGKRGGSA
jgi:hypothetical protein